MQESIGGQPDSEKAAYVLVYVDDFLVKKSLEINLLDHVRAAHLQNGSRRWKS